jgi:tetratricopeptide (TPR) repeat protein
MAAYVAPDAIPKSVFDVLVAEDTAVARHRLAVAFNALARFSLATLSDASVSVHRLLQKTIRDDALQRHDQTAGRRTLNAVDDAFPTDVSSPAHWPRCEQLLSHVLALKDALHAPGDAGPELISLLNRACDYLQWAEGGRRALTLAEGTLPLAERILGAEHPDTLGARHNIADAHQDTGRVEDAIAIYEPLLSTTERVLGAEHPHTVTTRHDLAFAYQAAGRVENAIAIYEPLLSTTERVLGAEHPDTLATRHNIASAYQTAGRVEDAIAILEPLLSIRERVLGAEHPDTLATRHALARVYRYHEPGP